MFEKSLYDLIRGLRNHKGREREYIQDVLRECWKEIKSQDMNLKATALLKLTYLEMFGHDMSSASFHVLEVMSSPKYQQKRLGYLGAVQSFRQDTEVLMLAENLLKKDLTSPSPPTISSALIAIPHVVTPSMANSLLSDLLPRLTHSHASIRKKTIVTLYRLALVYPETLRPAWPKIRERLLDPDENPSVTAAVVNVVCELGWRRPQDFLPLAPRLFELLVNGTNNWMAIKLIKMFAVLTPLEPRLVKKLLPQLTTLLKTTPAMSLLYECINGIIQGGILQSASQTTEGDEIARLCVGKLRSMLVAGSDPNLKYVALLAFNKIVQSYPDLISEHEDLIMECIDDVDISIRLRALDLASGMVNADNLTSIVDRLMRQLSNAPLSRAAEDPSYDRSDEDGIVPTGDMGDDPEMTSQLNRDRDSQALPLPDDYRATVIQKILDMCSRNTYANIVDFDWYINILVRLVKYLPASSRTAHEPVEIGTDYDLSGHQHTFAHDIGSELRNLAVRVKSCRLEATRAAESLVAIDQRERLFPSAGTGAQAVLEPVLWVVGEFSEFLSNAEGTLTSLLDASAVQTDANTLRAYVHAIPKVFTSIIRHEHASYTEEGRITASLLIARIVHFLEPLSTHADLEVQERAVEYLELLRLAGEAVSSQPTSKDDTAFSEPSLLLSQVIPSLFTGPELNPVAPGAQRKVPIPEDLDLDAPINENLAELLYVPDWNANDGMDKDMDIFYRERPIAQPRAEPALRKLDAYEPEASYQQPAIELLDPDQVARRKAERRERNRDDPFYIPSDSNSRASTPSQNLLKTHNGETLDIDAIPIMDLDLNLDSSDSNSTKKRRAQASRPKVGRVHEILGDETVGDEQDHDGQSLQSSENDSRGNSSRRNFLQVDSSRLGTLSLDDSTRRNKQPLDIEQREAEDAEMARALAEVERLRREMQRASERVQARSSLDGDGMPVKRRKKKKVAVLVDPQTGLPAVDEGAALAGEAQETVEMKKKKKKKKSESADLQGSEGTEGAGDVAADAPAKKKRVKKRQAVLEEP